LIIRFLASTSPLSILFASSTSSAALSSAYFPASFRKSWSESVVAVARSPLTYVAAPTVSRPQSSERMIPRSSTSA
jgi:hypothetical protein